MLGKQISLKDMESVVRPYSHFFIVWFIQSALNKIFLIKIFFIFKTRTNRSQSLPTGQWILQLPKMDSGKWPHWAWPEVLYWRGQLWTGVQSFSHMYLISKDLICCLASRLISIQLFHFFAFSSDISGGPEAQWLRHGGYQWQQKRVHWVSRIQLL